MGNLRSGSFWRGFFAVIGTLVVAACAGPKAAQNIAENHTFSAASGTGIVIGSIIARSPFPNQSILLYRKVGTSDEGYFETSGSELIAAELPAGDYEVASWRVRVEDGYIIPAKLFRVGFRVTPGKAVYLGSYDFHMGIEALGDTQFASSVPNSKWLVDVTCTNQSERDLSAFVTRHRALSGLEIATIQSEECHQNLGDGSRYFARPLRLGPALGL